MADMSDGPGEPIVGTKKADKISGTDASEMIFGGGGDDTILGSGGADTINGGSGDDRIVLDVFDRPAPLIAGGGGFDVLVASSNLTSTELRSIERIESMGYQIVVFEDQIFNRHAENRLGIAGLEGRRDDLLINGLDGKLNASRLVLENWDYADTVRLWTWDGDDRIIGSDYNDQIIGYAGDDRLRGGAGVDTLIGGSGADVFILDVSSSPEEPDDASDFWAGEGDRLRLVFDEADGMRRGKLSADAFHVGAAAADASDRVIYDAGRGMLLYDRDGSGSDYDALAIARIGRNAFDLTHDDIVIA